MYIIMIMSSFLCALIIGIFIGAIITIIVIGILDMLQDKRRI